MRYAVIFLILGVCFIALGLQTRGWGWLFLWPGLSATLVGAGYAGLGARVFGKRADGRFSFWAIVLHMPYLLITLGVWYLIRWTIPESSADEIAPGIWVARRPLHGEIPSTVRCVVDVTAEFWVGRRVRDGRDYLCFPTLDGHVCDDCAFAQAAKRIADFEGPVLIHCAQGHGRSAALAAAVLIARGLADDPEQAEAILIAARPGIALKPRQRQLVRRVADQLRPAPSKSA
jgi:protein-tyrosine phosphatase